jgi:hypothetical protein
MILARRSRHAVLPFSMAAHVAMATVGAFALALAGCEVDTANPLVPGSAPPSPSTSSSSAPFTDAGPPAPPADGSTTAPEANAPDASAAMDASGPQGEARGVFVAVGYGGRRVRSTDDGVTWTDDVSLVPRGGDDDNLLRTIVYGDGKFVALGYRAVVSVDGKSWLAPTAPFGQWIGAATWDTSKGFVAVGGYGLHATSRDGRTWSDHAFDTVASHCKHGIALGGGRFVSVNDDGARATSADGITWTRSQGAAGAVKTTSVAFGNGVFVAVGDTSAVRSTDGGLTFSAPAGLPSAASGIVFAQGHFTALSSGRVFTSPDGATWTTKASAEVRRGTVAYGHGAYVSIAEGGGIQRSSDGVVWSAPNTLPGANPLEAIAFGPL